MNNYHQPVLLEDCLTLLNLQEDDIFVDCTIGYAGHSLPCYDIIKEHGQLIGIDQDQTAFDHCTSVFKGQKNVSLFNDNYSNIHSCLSSLSLTHTNKILLDLGMSSVQLDSAERGFSFQHDSPLDMRMNQHAPQTAHDILHSYSHKELSDMFFYKGELRQNKILSEKIIQARHIGLKTTQDLVNIVKKSYFFNNSRHKYMKTLSQVFQALRIETNQEFKHLTLFLNSLENILVQQGRVVIISFHSLEDRLIKHFFNQHKDIYKKINKKVIKASQEEIKTNPRAHSAIVRAYEKL
ncbi:16S rRNA (cytosine(1402)-N(4))-methyltransferase [Candidatus Marinamargulisbacteria bacterium SCGC AG-414-C22]|nr:16S rRNA (cytosine(1402)-N(4))-methyltransferase [Candidatus Marinamargulisbacteria bacterium SCGC AG-414-C22]